jgi:plastocyanin
MLRTLFNGCPASSGFEARPWTLLPLVFFFVAYPGLLGAQPIMVTLPAVASIQGVTPFFSDVRAFNTSYAESLDVIATYRCFLGSCPTTTVQQSFTLQPREARAFDDMVASQSGFHAPNSAGGVEFTFTGTSEQLVVTSRLFSTAPTPTVGMFIPGLRNAEAYVDTVLTSVRNRGPDGGFRTNVGVFNPGDVPVTVGLQIFDNRVPVGNALTIPGGIAPHAGAQVNAVFTAANVPTLSTSNGVIVVTASAPIFSYAAVIDNNTSDPIFVVGSKDQPPEPITPFPSATNTPFGVSPTQTRTPTPPVPTNTPGGPTSTPTPPSGGVTRNVTVTSQGGTQFIDEVSGNSTSTITVGTTIHWVWGTGIHSTTSGPCPPCTGSGLWDSGQMSGQVTFDHTFTQAGTIPYFCSVHGISMTGTVIVNP